MVATKEHIQTDVNEAKLLAAQAPQNPSPFLESLSDLLNSGIDKGTKKKKGIITGKTRRLTVGKAST